MLTLPGRPVVCANKNRSITVTALPDSGNASGAAPRAGISIAIAASTMLKAGATWLSRVLYGGISGIPLKINAGP